MKNLVVIFILFWLSQTAFSATSNWVFYDEITCFVPLPQSVQTGWGSDGSEPVNFIVFNDSNFTIQLTDCLDSCELYSSDDFDRIYTSQILGDSLLEFHAKNAEGKIVKILYYRKIEKKLDLPFKDNPNIFMNGNNFLFQNISISGYEYSNSMQKTDYNTFHKISENIGNLYKLHRRTFFSSREVEHDNILFFIINDKVYCERFVRVHLGSNYSDPYRSDFETCTLEEARAEIQRISRKRRTLIDN